MTTAPLQIPIDHVSSCKYNASKCIGIIVQFIRGTIQYAKRSDCQDKKLQTFYRRDSRKGYSSGFGMMLPDTHYQTFGAGFAQLPMELGGQRAGAQGSRFSGRGME